jgi:O-antigen/teichoic acid export membrane protein
LTSELLNKSEQERKAERKDLDRSLVQGVAWSASARLISQLLTWAVTLIVARLLTPADYGVVAGAAIYLGLLGLLTEFGLGTAIVTQRDLPSTTIWQLGGFSVALGMTAWAVTTAASRLIANITGIAEVATILPVLGFATAVASLNALPYALLQKELKFRLLSQIEVFRSIIAAVALLAFAVLGFGYWSLVLNELVATLCLAFALYWKTRYRLHMPRWNNVRPSIVLSGRVMTSRVAWYTYTNADQGIVGKVLGKSALGDYSMASTLTNLPSQKIAAMIVGVTTGVLASVQHDAGELRRYFLGLVEMLSLVLLPAIAGLAMIAPVLVTVLLGEKWIGTVTIIQALAFATAIRAFGPVCSQVLLARLRADVELRYSLLSLCLLPIGFLIGVQFGGTGVALAWSVLSLPLSAYLLVLTCREIQLPVARLLAVVAKPFAAVLLMLIVLRVSRLLLDERSISSQVQLPLLIVCGALSYAVVIAAIMRDRVFALARLLKR